MQLAPLSLSTEEIIAVVEHCGGLTGLLHQATDEERAALYESIGGSAVYYPQHNQVRLCADPAASNACRRGDTHPKYMRAVASMARRSLSTRLLPRHCSATSCAPRWSVLAEGSADLSNRQSTE